MAIRRGPHPEESAPLRVAVRVARTAQRRVRVEPVLRKLHPRIPVTRARTR